jgi:hypothetical protein
MESGCASAPPHNFQRSLTGGDKVDSGIGLSYRPARLHRLTGRYVGVRCEV